MVRTQPDSITRRDFVKWAGAGLGALALAGEALAQAAQENLPPPNLLWIVSEDNNPFLGCYGNALVHTPTLDRLAREGVLYENCHSTAPVCAPARFTLITGVYPTCCAPGNNMRASGKRGAAMRGFPASLREAGYYCTNNAKTDYNTDIKPRQTWDESGRQAHWRNRPQGKPFFAVFNHEVTHESCQFSRVQQTTVDPAKVVLPPYHPDTPEFRQDWAHYFDQMGRLDQQVARLLAQLEEDGLAENTIVFYYGDNGGVLPRSKRFPYDSGTHVPLIIRFPEKYRHLAPGAPGARIPDPVSFIDFAPTVLSLAGVPIPKHLQGHAFAGPRNAGPQLYAFCFRDRMDERYDMIRTVRDRRYRYLRNYKPRLPWGQHVSYMFQQRSYRAWERLYRQGKLAGSQRLFWEEKPEEELYDLQNDPYEVNNLAKSPAHQEILQRMRRANEAHLLRIRDNGFIPEGSPLEGFDATRDPKVYPLERILEVANTATKRDPANLGKLAAWLRDPHECIRYWAALGCVMLREKAAGAADALAGRLQDDSESVRVVAAEALCGMGQEGKGLPVLESLLLKGGNGPVRLQAANALQNIGEKARPALASLEKAKGDSFQYTVRAVEYTVAVLRGQDPYAAGGGGEA